MGGLCLMVGVLAAVGVGWTAACVAQPELLGAESLLSVRLLTALLGALLFGGVGLLEDLARIRSRSVLGLRRHTRLGLEAAAGAVVLVLLGAKGCLAAGITLPGVGYVDLGIAAPLLWEGVLVALAECARIADGMDGIVCALAERGGEIEGWELWNIISVEDGKNECRKCGCRWMERLPVRCSDHCRGRRECHKIGNPFVLWFEDMV